MKSFVFVLVLAVGVSSHHRAEHLEKFQTDELVPDVIDKVPGTDLHVTYENDKEVHFGEELTPTNVKNQPAVTWKAEPEVYYTLAMVDPDAPSRKTPTFREVNHWLITNILGSELKSGEVITAYLGSGPPKDTGLHRYVFLLYRQPSKLEFDEPKTGATSRDHRLNFSIRKFAAKHKLGDPIAGNYFTAKWDSFVDERNKKFAKQ